MAEASAISDLVHHAGAVMTEREGRSVPAHYGSAAGELAVCVRRVGLALRSDLGLLSITATSAASDQLLDRVLGHGLAPGGAVLDGAAWWCRSPVENELVVISRHATRARLVRALHHEVNRFSNAQLTDRSDQYAIVSVVGQRTQSVLEELGVFAESGSPRTTSPFSSASVGGHDARWLLETETSALVLIDNAYAAAVWQAVYDAGRAHAISCVGIEATERYSLVGRPARSNVLTV